MKRVSFIAAALAIVILAASAFIPRPVYAASTTAYNDYLYQYDQYRTRLNEFKVARTEYIKFKTLTSESTALEKTKSMMTQRNLLLTTYLQYLLEKLNEDQGLSTSDKQLYRALLQNELTFLNGHSNLLPSIGSISDAVTVSKQLESHYALLMVTVRQTIVALTLGQLEAVNTQYLTTYRAASDLVNTSRATTTPQKQGTLDRWLLQINNKQNLYAQKRDEVSMANSALKGKTLEETDNAYRKMRQTMAEGRQYLSEGSAFMKELVNAMRVED